MKLFEKDSPKDLLLRGFSREEILQRTAVDVGYHGVLLKSECSEIDRLEYKAEYIIKNFEKSYVLQVLDAYAEGADKQQVLSMLGLSGVNITPLHQLFFKIGCNEDFKAADKKNRGYHMKYGFSAKFGTENPFCMKDFQDKAVQTRIEKYGGAYTLSHGSSLREGAVQKFSEHMQDNDFVTELNEKKKHSYEEHYGVRHCMKSSAVVAKMQSTMKERYNVSSYAKTEEFRTKMRDYMRVHGHEIHEKSVRTCLMKYGVPYFASTDTARENQSIRMRDSEYQKQIMQKKILSGTCNTSNPENELYDMLVSVFGKDDIILQYKDERYLFFCDFYVKSKDLFIELNTMWTHNTHWYTDDSTDKTIASDWLASSDAKLFYLNAYETWTNRDVAKRAAARHAKLNYVVFWDAGLDDARLWIAMGCPDGQDWEMEYSWLPHRNLRLSDKIPDLKPGWKSVVTAVRHANWRSFYHRELAMWQKDVPTRKGRLTGALYANRYKYLGKLPDELTSLEILRGMSIAGFVKGYSVFNNTAMDMVLQQYRPKYVYDPCAGWGERMLTCAQYDIGYLGVDINPHAVAGHDKLRKAYHLIGQATVKDDASVYDMSTSRHDAVITCPPYWKKEIYSEFGAENYSREEFLDWWSKVVKHSVSDTVKLFAYQISGDLATDMSAELFQYGFRMVSMIDTKQGHVSHFQRKQGTAKATEYMMVFVR